MWEMISLNVRGYFGFQSLEEVFFQLDRLLGVWLLAGIIVTATLFLDLSFFGGEFRFQSL